MSMRLDGKVAIVTGSTKGIGAEIARRFAAEGARVLVSGRSAELGEQVVEKIQGEGGQAVFVRADLANEPEVVALVDAAVEAFGELHILVNNAAPVDAIIGGAEKPVVEQTAAEFDSIMRVALNGAIHACRAAIPRMAAAGGGSIVNISSLASLQGVLGVHAYTCAKGALNAVTRQMAVDYAPVGVRSNCIVVGLIATEPLMSIFATYPGIEEKVAEATLTRIGQPEDVAEAATYLASDAAGYVTGVLLPVDGGLTCKGHLVGLPQTDMEYLLTFTRTQLHPDPTLPMEENLKRVVSTSESSTGCSSNGNASHTPATIWSASCCRPLSTATD